MFPFSFMEYFDEVILCIHLVCELELAILKKLTNI